MHVKFIPYCKVRYVSYSSSSSDVLILLAWYAAIVYVLRHWPSLQIHVSVTYFTWNSNTKDMQHIQHTCKEDTTFPNAPSHTAIDTIINEHLKYEPFLEIDGRVALEKVIEPAHPGTSAKRLSATYPCTHANTPLNNPCQPPNLL